MIIRRRGAAFQHAATILVALTVLLPIILTGCDDFLLIEQFPSVSPNGSEPLAITPSTAELAVEETTTFTASGGAGGYEFSVVEAGGGTVIANGNTAEYTAPDSPGDFTVRVTDAQGDTSDAVVTVTPAPQPLSISPATRQVQVGGTAIFTASGGAGDYEFSVVEAVGGSLEWSTDTAVYTAPSVSGGYTVRVTDKDDATADAAVTVTSSPQPLAISPTTASLYVGGTETFTASGGAGGYEFSVVEAGGGTISASGDAAEYTAPASSGEYTVRVSDYDGDFADAAVTVTHSPLTINPAVAAVNVGGSLTFVASGGAGGYVYSIASGPGTVHPTSGVYNAGTTAGESTVRVTDGEAQFVDSTVIVIENQELYIVPESVTISVDSTYQFGSVGGTGNKTFDMVSGDGSMSADGLYTAPSVPTTDQVEVIDEAGNRRVAVVYVVDTGALGISPLDPEIEEGSNISFSGYGGSPPYDITIENGTGTFDPATDTYTADSGQVGFDLVTISITDNDATTLETHITVRPAAPGDMVADGTYPGPKTIELSWTDNSNAETGYRVERKKGHGGTYAPIVTLAADAETYLDDDPALEPNNLYVYRVTAEAVGIESFPSGEASDLSNAVP